MIIYTLKNSNSGIACTILSLLEAPDTETMKGGTCIAILFGGLLHVL